MEQAHNIVVAEQYTPFVIPCKPTSPKVKVELIQEDGEVTVISYNEMIGFNVTSNRTPEFDIRCDFILNDTKNFDYHRIVVNRRFLSRLYLIAM